jgi:hypothetical protein
VSRHRARLQDPLRDSEHSSSRSFTLVALQLWAATFCAPRDIREHI